MRLALSISAALLAAAIFVPSVRAQASIPYRRTIPYLSNRLDALEGYPWPGNIRQLENVIQQAVLVSSGPELLLTHLPQPVQEYATLTNGNGSAGDAGNERRRGAGGP